MGDQLRTVVDIATQAGEIVKKYWRRVEAESKADQTVVTIADRESERFIRGALKRAFPNDTIVGEEFGISASDGSDRTWFIDPIDGTNNYVNGLPLWCVAIGLLEGGEAKLGVIYHPLVKDCYHGEVGVGAWLNDTPLTPWAGQGPFRSTDPVMVATELLNVGYEFGAEVRVRALGSAQLQFAYVASGAARCGFWHHDYGWDLVAGIALCRAAGVEVQTYDGAEPDLSLLRDGREQPWPLCAAPAATMPLLQSVLNRASVR